MVPLCTSKKNCNHKSKLNESQKKNTSHHPTATKTNYQIVLVYRNPTSTAIDDYEFYDNIDNVLSAPHETLIMGDFNLPYENQTTRQSRASSFNLIDLINSNSLQQHVNEPTRRNNILDLVVTTSYLRIIGIEVTGKISDHQMIDRSLSRLMYTTLPQGLKKNTSPTKNRQTSNKWKKNLAALTTPYKEQNCRGMLHDT
ncbi:Endonuclease/exonuclease/phosphatase [Trinorchestia longiramus]|nr:Endonuclease/exonuclease/phosphatase [Trinorchestia longiramus]